MDPSMSEKQGNMERMKWDCPRIAREAAKGYADFCPLSLKSFSTNRWGKKVMGAHKKTTQ